jgi:hypothetical protein
MPGEAAETTPETYSLANFAEILFPCLDAASVRTVVEVGAFRGDFTRELLRWAEGPRANVTAIEPEPPSDLLALAGAHPELTLVEQDSHTALASLELADAVILDGDHNYYTVGEELRLIRETARGSGMPLLIFHDVCWPHARRDTYYSPERIPEEHRQPLAHDVRLAPGISGTATTGIRYAWAAEREGGPRNGVLTAIEDFVEGEPGLRLAVVPAFFGLGLLWPEDAPWAEEVARIVDPWDSSPMLRRMEEARVAQIIDHMRLESQKKVLRSLLNSRAFVLAERLSNLRQRGAPVFSREQVRRALGD